MVFYHNAPHWCLPSGSDCKESAFQSKIHRKLGFNPNWGDPLEKEMTAHSSVLVWDIPWTEQPGGLQSLGSQRVGQD